MARTAVADTGFLVALLTRRDQHHDWAVEQARRSPPPWRTCEAVVSETFHVLRRAGAWGTVVALLRGGALICSFRFADDDNAVLRLMDKYADVPMAFADACLVRMAETMNDPVVLTTDRDFRIYRRHGRQVIPSVTPF